MKCTYLGTSGNNSITPITPIKLILNIADCGEDVPDSAINHNEKDPTTDPNKCTALPRDYNTTEEDRTDFCIGINFRKCPRYIDGIKLEKKR